MMREYLGKKVLYSTVLTAMLVLGGCSSSDGESSSDTGATTPTSTASGLVVDGYIANGHLYADLDGSKGENTGDISTTTNAQGNFSFGETTIAHGTYLYVTGGTDLATNTPFTGELSAYFFGEATVVSPLSTLIVSLMQNEGLSYDEAVTRAATMMGLSEAQVVADPMTDPDVFIASQRVVAAATTLGGDFSTAVDALASSNMDITAAAAALDPAADPANALAVDAYIVELQTKVPADATADDLVNYQLIITDAVSNPTAIPDVDDALAVANALSCVTFDAIKGTNTAENNITTDLVLGSCETGDDNVSFTWNSDNTALLSDAGAVISPVYIGDNVNLSVTITSDANSSVSTDKTFALSIPRLDNHPPVATADVNTTAEETQISFNILANDTDADSDALSLVAVSDGVAFNADGTVTYTPVLDFNGDFSFNYTVRDSWNAETNGTVTITVTAVNDAPVLDAIGTKMLEEDFALTTYEINATDVDSGSLTYSVTAVEPAIVNASFVSGNQLELTPITDLFGDTNITVMVSDGDKNDTVTFVVHITAVDDAPTIDTIENPEPVNEDSNDLQIAYTAGDVDSNLNVTVDSNDSTIATATILRINTIDYVIVTPLANQFGVVQITLSADDGVNAAVTESFTVTINAVDDAPVLSALSPITVMEDNGTTIVTATATDVDNDNAAIVYSMTSSDINIVTVSGMELTTVADANGVAEINVTATSNGKTDSQVFIFTVTSVDDAPVLEPISPKVVNEDNGTITVSPSATDVDNDDGLISYEFVSLNTSVVTVSGSDLVTVPNANGVATIEVTARSGALSDTTDFNVTVTAVNDAPTASDFTVPVVTGTSGNTIDISTHIDDVDGDALAITVFDPVSGLSKTADTTFNYDNDGTEGQITFNYTVEDPDGLPASGVVTLNVSTEPVIPVANDDVATTDEEVAVNIDVLANDVNVNSISTAWVVTPENGTVQVEANNTITFTPATDKSGLFLVKYTGVSATGHEDNGTVSVTVTDINDAPVINFTTSTPLSLTETTDERVVRVDMNITDVDTLLSSVTVDVSSNIGTITVQGYGTDYVDVLIPAYANGDANITVTANDGEDISTASFMVYVTAVDSLATITPTMIDVNITAGTQNFSLNVAPVDETYTLSIVSSGDGNIAFFQVSGYTLEVTPNTEGTTSIVVRATNDSNNTLESDTTITVHVYDPDNIAPVAYDGNISVVADEIINGALSASDANGDLLGFTIVKPPVHGSIVRREPWGTYAYAAMDGYIGQDSFTFTASDGALDSNIATVTIDVTLSSNTDNNNGDLTEKPITVGEFNAYTALTAYEMQMYSVWENGSVGQSELEPERLVIHENPAEIDVLNMETNVTQHIHYTLDTDSATLLIDFDANGSIDFKAKYVGTATKTELENELNLTLPDGSAGYKLATLQLEPNYDVWNDPEYADWNESGGSNPYSSLDTFMTDKSYDPNTPSYHTIQIDGYQFKFVEGSAPSDMNGTIIRTAIYQDSSNNDVEVITNANAGTWELVTVDSQDYILVTPTVYGLNKVQLYTVDSGDNLVHSGEYRPANRASLEYKFDETTMYHIANSIMNREVTMPYTILADGLSEFISFNTLATASLVQDSKMTAIWANDDGNGYEINTHGLDFDSNGSLYMTDSRDGDTNMTYSLSGNIVTIDGAGIEGKVVEVITSAAEVSALTGVPQGDLPTSPVLYRFAHIDPNANLDLWGDTVYGLDTSTTYSNFAGFQTAFMSGEVVLDYTPNGGIGYAGGIAGVGGTLAEYDSSLNIITPNAGTWEVVNFDGQDIIVFDATVERFGDHNAVGYDDSISLMGHGRYSPSDSGSVELRYNDETTAAIISYLQSNPVTYEKEIRIRRDIEAVPFTNDKMYTADLDVNSTTCESNVTQTYVWFNGNSSSGTFVISNVAGTGPYVSTDGKIVVVPDNDAGNDLYLKVNRELNATELMTMTSLYLPISARGYEVSYMNKDDDSASGEILFDLSTVQFLESYLNNNPMANTGCTLPQP